jgi:MFS transporter, DHA2 family, multidrug resistance protein
MPLVGFMLSKFDARKLLVFGLAAVGLSLIHMTSFDATIDFRTAATDRVFQALGLAFLFVPINTTAYAFLPKEKNNAASGLINLARNIGGSIGISVVTTMLARRAQVHQTNLSANVHAGSVRMQAMLSAMQHMLVGRGSSSWEAARQAHGMVAGMIDQQATVLAYIDCFWLLGIAALTMIPFVFLMKRVKPGGPIAVH